MGQVDFGSGAKPSVIDSSPQSPLQPETFTFTFPDCAKTLDNGCLRAALMSSTPGYLAVTVNNVSIGTAEFWDYSVAGWQFDLAPDMGKLQLHKGERVTVTITPQYVSGPWQLGIATKPTK